jgi:hypothetical protein
VHPVDSYYTNHSRCTIHKTLKKRDSVCETGSRRFSYHFVDILEAGGGNSPSDNISAKVLAGDKVARYGVGACYEISFVSEDSNQSGTAWS